MKRSRLLERCALALAALASFATSQPPPDWVQNDELAIETLAVGPGQDTNLTFYVEGPPESVLVYARLDASRAAFLRLSATPEGAAEPCVTSLVRSNSWAPPSGEPPRPSLSFSLPPECGLASGGVITLTMRADEAFESSDVAVDVTLKATAAGYDDDEKDPYVHLERR
jgi:hypothetical protein